MRVVCVSDKKGTAIDRLARGVEKYHGNIEYFVCDVHPKRPDPKQLKAFEEAAKTADIIDWQYFRTAEMLRAKYDWLKEKKHILTHNNPYSIHEQDWNGYDMVVANNKTMFQDLSKITQSPLEYIPLVADTDYWSFNQEWKPNKTVIMVVNRIESKKGVLEVAIACGELGYKFILVGNVSDRGYMDAVMQTGSVEFHENITDEQLRDLYHQSSLHVCNSVDNFESGTLPILESMLCGVPVLTRLVGHVPELNNGENMVINDQTNDDVLHLVELMRKTVEDTDKLKQLREKGWQTAKNRNFQRRAYNYQQKYRQLLYSNERPVTVIMPVYDDIKPEVFKAITSQTYQNIEIILVNDNPYKKPQQLPHTNKMLRAINTARIEDDYGLARARNEAAIQATGEILVFCDQRMKMQKHCVEEFVKNLKPKTWLYGNKGVKKDFIENLSCINRQDFINFGMFNERMDCYGGLSQETRARARLQGLNLEYVEKAEAIPTGKSSNRNRKRYQIIRSKNRLWQMNLE